MVTRREVKTPFGLKVNYFVKGEWIYSEYESAAKQEPATPVKKTPKVAQESTSWFGMFRRKRSLAVS